MEQALVRGMKSILPVLFYSNLYAHFSCTICRSKNVLVDRKQGLDLGPGFVTHGSVEQLYDHVGLSGVRIAEAARNLVRNEDD